MMLSQRIWLYDSKLFQKKTVCLTGGCHGAHSPGALLGGLMIDKHYRFKEFEQ